MSPDESYPTSTPSTPTSPPSPLSTGKPPLELPVELLQTIFTNCHPGHLWLCIRPVCRKSRDIIESHPTRFLTSENANIRIDVFSFVHPGRNGGGGGFGLGIRQRYLPFSKFVRDPMEGDVVRFEARLKVAMPYASIMSVKNSVLSMWEGVEGWKVERYGVISMVEVDEMPSPLERVTDIVNRQSVWATHRPLPREAEVRVVYEIPAGRFFPPLGYAFEGGCMFFDTPEVGVAREAKEEKEEATKDGKEVRSSSL